MNSTTLKRLGVKNINIKDKDYFHVQDIKDNFPDLKLDSKQIIYKDDVALIHPDHVHLMTDFDKMMLKSLKSKK